MNSSNPRVSNDLTVYTRPCQVSWYSSSSTLGLLVRSYVATFVIALALLNSASFAACAICCNYYTLEARIRFENINYTTEQPTAKIRKTKISRFVIITLQRIGLNRRKKNERKKFHAHRLKCNFFLRLLSVRFDIPSSQVSNKLQGYIVFFSFGSAVFANIVVPVV